VGPPAVNSLYPRLPRAAITALQDWSPFYDWDEANQQVRWMASWDTTSDDVERFAAGVRLALEG
jgi:threonine aldolase